MTSCHRSAGYTVVGLPPFSLDLGAFEKASDRTMGTKYINFGVHMEACDKDAAYKAGRGGERGHGKEGGRGDFSCVSLCVPLACHDPRVPFRQPSPRRHNIDSIRMQNVYIRVPTIVSHGHQIRTVVYPYPLTPKKQSSFLRLPPNVFSIPLKISSFIARHFSPIYSTVYALFVTDQSTVRSVLLTRS